MQCEDLGIVDLDGLPGWVGSPARAYLAHTAGGRSLRALARARRVHPSTVLRQVRRIEARRDDPLVDEALTLLGAAFPALRSDPSSRDTLPMNAITPKDDTLPDESELKREARRVLRRLAEPGACLALAHGLEKAVVVRETDDGRSIRTAVLDRSVARAFALKDWISCCGQGRIVRYRITEAGRAALRRLVAEETAERQGMAEAATPFAAQHGDWRMRRDPEAGGERRRIVYNAAESPLAALARRRDKEGRPFLDDGLVAAGERLREDFELAQMGPRVAQNWERFLTGGARGGLGRERMMGSGPEAARARVMAALADLGPGLGDVALRCCCFLEGLEQTERRMGWSARSGKIVLRIALQRLKRHYDSLGDGAKLIG